MFLESLPGGGTQKSINWGLVYELTIALSGTESGRTRIWGHRQEDANRCPRWQKMMCKYHSESWEASAGPGPWVPPYLPTEDVIQDLSHNHYRYPFKFNLVSGAVIFGRIIV